MIKRRVFQFLYLTFFTSLLLTLPASAYIDPATTSYIIQIVAAFFITVGVLFSALTARARMFFAKIKMKLMEEYYRSKSKNNDHSDEPAAGTLAGLWYDKRSFISRLLLAAVCSFAITFTFVIFGSFDLFFANKDIFTFIFADIWLPILLVGLGSFTVLTVFFVLFKGKIFNTLISLAVGILLAGYVQGNFLNLSLGQLTGDAVSWHLYTGHMLLNSLVWIILVSIPFVVGFFSKIVWKGFCTALPSLLVVIQVVSLVVSLAGMSKADVVSRDYYLSTQGIYEVSSKKNIIVFILDRLDELYIKEILEEDPDYFNDLDGFTRYTNNVSYYCRTYPSGVNMLTGAVSLYDIPAKEFVTKAYADSPFLPDLRAHDFTTKLYMEEYYTYTDIEQLASLADNVIHGRVVSDTAPITKKLMRLSAFRYVPHMMKPSFWLSTGDFAENTSEVIDFPPYNTNDFWFYQNMKSQGLTVQNEKNNFLYYHLNGSHDPLTINENVELVPKEQTSTKQQTMGCFNIVRETIRQLKEQGLYEDANIIITGDHGKSYDATPLGHAVLTGLFVKPAGSHGTPLKYSNAPVNPDNLRGTIIKMAGIESDQYAPAYWEVPEDADIIRKYYYRINGSGGKDQGYVEEFEIRGDANDFANWHKLGDIKIKHVHG